MMGRHDALKEMLLVKPDAARALVNRGETILHLCVKYCQLEVLKLLLNTTDFQELVNRKDKNGNTILHLSVADSQVETTEFLLSVAGIEVNALNHSGMTAMEILIQRKNNTRNIEMEESLKHAGAFGVEESSHPPPNFRPRNMGNQALFMHPDQRFCSSRDFQENIWKKILKNKDDWLEKKRNAMMVVATLIAGMAFEVGVSPPEGVWQKENNALDLENSEEEFHRISNRNHSVCVDMSDGSPPNWAHDPVVFQNDQNGDESIDIEKKEAFMTNNSY